MAANIETALSELSNKLYNDTLAEKYKDYHNLTYSFENHIKIYRLIDEYVKLYVDSCNSTNSCTKTLLDTRRKDIERLLHEYYVIDRTEISRIYEFDSKQYSD